MTRNGTTWRRRLMAGVIATVVVCSPVAWSGTVSADSPAVTGLTQGSTGDAVRQVQQALIDHGVSLPGGVDGVFGAGTVAALKTFQTRQGLNATGKVDEMTAVALGLTTNPYFGLAQGASGDAVTQLQQRLIEVGMSISTGVDGVYGPATVDAVKRYQRSIGYSPTGSVNAATAVRLAKASATTPATTPATNPAPAPTPAASSSGSTTAPSTSSTVLKIGSRGDAVKNVQRQLIAAGFTIVGPVDGIYGVLTASAVSAFQKSVGLPATGAVDDATAAKLAAPTTPGSSSGSSGGTTTPTASSPLIGLQLGARGDAVKQLQQALINAGVAVKGGADGIFGSATQTALKAYQTAAGLPASGLVDDATASALASGKPVGGGSSTPAASPLLGLKAGSLGQSVKDLQQALINAGVTVRGGADGIFGPATAQALKAFQTSQGLPATGVVDDATIAALKQPKPATPTTPSGGSTAGYAQYGEKGPRVVALQSALMNAGITVRGGADGDFGSGTSAAVMDFQRAHGLKVTGKVDDATAAALGLAKQDAPTVPSPATVSIQVFPVQGKCWFSDTYGAARSGGRTHLGVDVIASAGKLEYAVVDGTITKIYTDYPGSLSGNGVRLTAADGTYFFYAHMSQVADGITVGTKVRAGQVLGYLGNTGNTGGTNHLHFEVHPKGGSAVNPYPVVKAVDACNVTTPLPQ